MATMTRYDDRKTLLEHLQSKARILGTVVYGLERRQISTDLARDWLKEENLLDEKD